MAKPEIEELYKYWKKIGVEGRLKKKFPIKRTVFARQNEVSMETLKLWDKKHRKQREEELTRAVVQKPVVEVVSPVEDEILEDEEPIERAEVDEVREVMDALKYMATKRHNAFAARTFLQAKGELVEKTKQEVTIGYSADEIARRNLEADRQLFNSGFRVAEVQEESPLLPEAIWEDTGQTPGDNTV